MRELDGRRLRSRTSGRQAIERSIRLLVIRVNRFRLHRAQSARDVLWCARAADVLRELLGDVDRQEGAP